MDALFDAQSRERSSRSWRFWLSVAALSGLSLYFVTVEALNSWVRLGLAIAGGIGLLAFLVYLSTKPYGRSDSSAAFGRWWW